MRRFRHILFSVFVSILTLACGLSQALTRPTPLVQPAATLPPTVPAQKTEAPPNAATPSASPTAAQATPSAAPTAAPQNTATPTSSPTAALIVADAEHRVTVQPVFFVPTGETEPTPEQQQALLRHLQWAQQRYLELLAGQDTFQLTSDQAWVYRAKNPLSFYRSAPESGAPQYLSELLDDSQTNRLDAASIYLVVVMSPFDDFPPGGGRPINGGYNTGGGIVILSSYALNTFPNFQSTLQHELGHSFGLPHVDTYGYSMDSNPSIMSYNLAHHTNGFSASATPGIWIPEDLRGLALNHQVFPRLTFKPERDVPKSYRLKGIVCLGPMDIPGQPSWLATVTTSSGEDYGTRVTNALQHLIRPSTEKAGFDPDNMWHSKKTDTGWVSLEVTFPIPITLDRIAVHSQHSGQYHAAKQVKVQAFSQGAYQDSSPQALSSVDATVSFPAATAQRWQFSFQAGESGYVVIRGLQFFNGEKELFPPPVPWAGGFSQ